MAVPQENDLFPPDPAWVEVFKAVQCACLKEWGHHAVSLTVRLSHGRGHTFPVPVVPPRPVREAPKWDSGPEPKHLSDFQLVYWPGLGTIRFTAQQARAVAVLWAAMVEGSHWVGQPALLRAAGSDATRCSDLFRRCDGWGTLILKGDGPLYRLRPLEEEPPPEGTRCVPDHDA